MYDFISKLFGKLTVWTLLVGGTLIITLSLVGPLFLPTYKEYLNTKYSDFDHGELLAKEEYNKNKYKFFLSPLIFIFVFALAKKFGNY